MNDQDIRYAINIDFVFEILTRRRGPILKTNLFFTASCHDMKYNTLDQLLIFHEL